MKDLAPQGSDERSPREALRVLVLNGPNLNLLGRREVVRYGTRTLAEVEAELREEANRQGCMVTFYQSNSEGDLVTRVQECIGTVDGLLINPGAYGHTSIALRDALLATELPAVEVHITNIHGREPFRRRSLLADVVTGGVFGLGTEGYLLALKGLLTRLKGAARPPAPTE